MLLSVSGDAAHLLLKLSSPCNFFLPSFMHTRTHTHTCAQCSHQEHVCACVYACVHMCTHICMYMCVCMCPLLTSVSFHILVTLRALPTHGHCVHCPAFQGRWSERVLAVAGGPGALPWRRACGATSPLGGPVLPEECRPARPGPRRGRLALAASPRRGRLRSPAVCGLTPDGPLETGPRLGPGEQTSGGRCGRGCSRTGQLPSRPSARHCATFLFLFRLGLHPTSSAGPPAATSLGASGHIASRFVSSRLT